MDKRKRNAERAAMIAALGDRMRWLVDAEIELMLDGWILARSQPDQQGDSNV